ncbi:MAG TPA: YtxH domain-containing protein [Longimicrobiales bacterium]|nr:YtxH domain-containing protein [Longimicrobiales bacterium]
MTSFLKGALAGAVVAFLYAPKRGEETRARARNEIEGLLARIEATLRNAGENLTEQLEDWRERAVGAVEGDPDGYPGA